MTTITVKEHPTEPNTSILIVGGDDDSMSYDGDCVIYPLLKAKIDRYNRSMEYHGKLYKDIKTFRDLYTILEPSTVLFKNYKGDSYKFQYQYTDLCCEWRGYQNCPKGFVDRHVGSIKVGDILAFASPNPDQEPLNYKGDEHDNTIVQLPYIIREEIEVLKIARNGNHYYFSYMKDGEMKELHSCGGEFPVKK